MNCPLPPFTAAFTAAYVVTPCLTGTYSQLQGVEEHEAAIRQFTPPGFPEAWVPLMAQQMAQTPPNRCVLG